MLCGMAESRRLKNDRTDDIDDDLRAPIHSIPFHPSRFSPPSVGWANCFTLRFRNCFRFYFVRYRRVLVCNLHCSHTPLYIVAFIPDRCHTRFAMQSGAGRGCFVRQRQCAGGVE